MINLYIPTDYGGSELDCMTGCVIGEELAYGCSGIKIAIIITDVAVIYK